MEKNYKGIISQRSGSNVVANPTLEGNESLLNSITINGVNYKVGGSGYTEGTAIKDAMYEDWELESDDEWDTQAHKINIDLSSLKVNETHKFEYINLMEFIYEKVRPVCLENQIQTLSRIDFKLPTYSSFLKNYKIKINCNLDYLLTEAYEVFDLYSLELNFGGTHIFTDVLTNPPSMMDYGYINNEGEDSYISSLICNSDRGIYNYMILIEFDEEGTCKVSYTYPMEF